MKNLTVVSDEPNDLKVLHDLLKAHFPGVRLKHLLIDDMYAQVPDDEREPETLMLTVKRYEAAKVIEITLEFRQRKYSQRETVLPALFAEEEINRHRRILRLSVYRALCWLYKDYRDFAPSPWGVLTGVRPTKIVHRLFDQKLSAEQILLCLEQDFGISAEKAGLVYRTALCQLPYLLKNEEMQKRVSIYICIPFCPTRCHYCSFPAYALGRWGHLLDRYVAALEKEMSAIGACLKQTGLTVQTVYFGGGTPTALFADQLERLLRLAGSAFPLEKECEFTVEGGRPDTLDLQKIKIMRENQVNRLSINPQTMCDETLAAVGREHTADDILQSCRLARQIGIPVINMDLIIGLPGEDRHILAETLEKVVGLQPENITVHALAIKRAALYAQQRDETQKWAEGQAMMSLAHDFIGKAGYIPYYLYRQKDIFAHGENVGYTKKGRACVYNIQMIEEKQTIVGLGVGSGSKFINPHNGSVDNVYNPKDLLMYLDRLDENILKKVDKLQGFVYNNF